MKSQDESATMEMSWNPALAVTNLRLASHILSDRCLKLSAKWCAEQWMGLPPDAVENDRSDSNTDSAATTIPEEFLPSVTETNPAVQYSKTVFELGEYKHAAAILSETCVSQFSNASSVECMPPPLPDLSPKAFYFRAYALFLAGERAKEEQLLELENNASNSPQGGNKGSSCGVACVSENSAKNPYLSQLCDEMLQAYEDRTLDAFGLHVYGMVLSNVKVAPVGSPSAQSVLMQSIQQFPYNWSAWLDLASVCLKSNNNNHNCADVEQEIACELQPILAGHFCYHFFCAHLHTERQQHAEALPIYKRWLDFFDGSPYLMSQYAVCSYHLREFAQAESLLRDLHRHMPYRLDSMEVLSNILYVKNDALSLSHLAHTACMVDPYRAETCCIIGTSIFPIFGLSCLSLQKFYLTKNESVCFPNIGNYYSLKQQRSKAVTYFKRALQLDRNFSSAWTLIGHEYIEWKQTAHALEAYRRAVSTSPTDYRAWYGLGQTYELLNLNLYALYYYKQAVALRPYDARMWCALGTTLAHLKRNPDAVRALERAVQLDETEGVATVKLAPLYRQQGQMEKAAQCYMRHLEIVRAFQQLLLSLGCR